MKCGKYIVALAMTGVLAACGGGGGGGDGGNSVAVPITSNLIFPFRTGLNRLRANGFSKSFNATVTSPFSGGCNSSGTATLNQAPANTATTFKGSPAFSAVFVANVSLTSCSSNAVTQTYYYSNDYSDLGVLYSSGEYQVPASAFTIPNNVAVGSAGILGTMTNFDTPFSLTSNGRVDVSYVVEADTASTAIINIIQKYYAWFMGPNILHSTEQQRYRIDSQGTMTLISIDNQQTYAGNIYQIHTILK